MAKKIIIVGSGSAVKAVAKKAAEYANSVKDSKKCPYCNGHGYIDEGGFGACFLDCEECNGTGEIDKL